jgi:hypothetical protein
MRKSAHEAMLDSASQERVHKHALEKYTRYNTYCLQGQEINFELYKGKPRLGRKI